MSSNYSSNGNTGLSPDDPLFWTLPTPADCKAIRIIGIFLCLAAYTGFILNGSLLASFFRHKALRTPPNIFIMFMSAVGLFACCGNMPLSGSSSIFCYWLYGRTGCQIEGFSAFLYGTASCYLLCAVSLSRCYIVVRPFNAKDVTAARTSCCTNLYDRRRSYVSYNIVIFVFIYCVPLTILLITNTTIYMGLKRMREKVAHGAKAELSQKRIEMERRILKSIVITVFGFIFTWTPYTVIFFITGFSKSSDSLSPITIFICACFAKTSVVWIPLLYMGTSTQFRFSLVDLNALDKMSATTSVAGEASKAVAAGRQNDKKTAANDNQTANKDIDATD